MRTQLQIAADRAAGAARHAAGSDLRRIREDAGLTRAAVARVAGIDASWLADAEEGRGAASIQTLTRMAIALGADLGVRVFPNTGPRIRDRFQGPMIEALLRLTSPSYERFPEVPVRRPVRGVIDLVLASIEIGRIISIEAHSDIRRLEQQIRWAAEKTDALPSATIWPAITIPGSPATVFRVLLLRSTSRTRAMAREFEATLTAAYPADPTEALDALVDLARPWPGHAILWADVTPGAAGILRGSPRGVPRRERAAAGLTTRIR